MTAAVEPPQLEWEKGVLQVLAVRAPLSTRRSAVAKLHQKLTDRSSQKSVEAITHNATKRQEAAAARRKAASQQLQSRLSRERERGLVVRQQLETRPRLRAEELADQSMHKQEQAKQQREARRTDKATQMARSRRNASNVRLRRAAADRIFGDVVLDNEVLQAFMEHVKANHVGEISRLMDTGELDRMRNHQNHNGDSALILAAWYGHAEMVERLLTVRSDVNLSNRDGNTALNCAALKGHLDVVVLILDEDPDLEVADEVTGKTALLKASYAGHTEVVEELLKCGADPDTADDNGYTSLAFAASFCHHAVLHSLLRHSAEPDPKDTFGVTPLMHAATRGDADTLGALLQAGAHVDEVDVDGRSAVDYAEAGDFWDLLAQMEAHIKKARGEWWGSAGGGGGNEGSLTVRALQKAEESFTYRGASFDGSSALRITPRVPTAAKPEAPMTPRKGSMTPCGSMTPRKGSTPRNSGVQGASTPRISAEKMIAVAKADPQALTFLTKKLCNLTLLLQHDTIGHDSLYPRFSTAQG